MVTIYYIEKNNKPFYIGKTINPKNRAGNHRKTYGNDIDFIELDIVDSNKEIWKFWESFYINLFKSWGFELTNKNDGGGGPECQSNTTKSKQRLAALGKSKIEKHRLNISKSKKGKLPPFAGRKHSEESKNKIKNNIKRNEKIKNRNINWNKPILQYDLNGNFIKEWFSSKEASKIIKGDINACLKERTKKAGGYIWKYKVM